MKKYFRNIDEVLNQRSPNEIREIALLLVVLISLADYIVGYEISTSLFFLIPIALATWYGTYRQGVFSRFFPPSSGTRPILSSLHTHTVIH